MYQIPFLSKQEVAEDTYLYQFEKPEGYFFRAGQYVSLHAISGDNTDEMGNRRALSIASAPYQESLDFVMRQSESAFKKNMATLKPGDMVEITPAVGRCVLPDLGSESIIIALVGGVGITPVRSMVHQSLFERRKEQWKIFYSNRTIESAPLLEEFLAIENENISCVYTMTDLPNEDPWEGERGFITRDMIARYEPDFDKAFFFIVGTAEFVAAMKQLLEESSIHPGRIVADNFGPAHK